MTAHNDILVQTLMTAHNDILVQTLMALVESDQTESAQKTILLDAIEGLSDLAFAIAKKQETSS